MDGCACRCGLGEDMEKESQEREDREKSGGEDNNLVVA